MTTAELLTSDPVRIGPEGAPTLTLGWEVLDWQLDYLLQPDGDTAGLPWTLTPEQVRFVLWWYAIDKSGRFVYRRGVLRRMKGWGKDPLCASLALTEMLGPCRFAGFDANGNPVAKPQNSAWIQVAATSIYQTVNTFAVFPGMISDALREEYGMDLGKERIYSAAGDRIEAVTSSPRALEGGRPTFIIANETQHWLPGNEGHSMMRVISRNLAKSSSGGARALAITNAHSPGEDSVAEHDYEAHLAISEGRSNATGLLYDSREAPAGIELKDREKLRAGLIAARGDSVWLDVDRLIEEIYDPTTPASMSRRYYLNEVTAAEDSWIAPFEWDPCATDEKLQLNDTICLGFDGSIKDDSTALVACRLSDGLLSLLGIWEKPDMADDDWQVDRVAVNATVAETMEKYNVIGFYCDPAHWQDYVDAWTQKWGHSMLQPAINGKPLEWWTHRPLAMIHALQRFREAVVMKELKHDGGKVLRRQVLNAKNRTGAQGITIAKEHPHSKRKIDAAMAATLAYECRSDAVARRLQDRLSRPRRAVSF